MATTISGDTGVSQVQDGSITAADLSTAAVGSAAPQRMMLTTTQATTSGTFIDFTGIPSWAKKITVMLNGVSTNGASAGLVQLGVVGGIENTGYTSAASDDSTGTQSTSGFILGDSASGATAIRYTMLTLIQATGNTWIGSGVNYTSVVRTNCEVLAGAKTLSSTLDRIRLTTVNGTDTFDAGSVSLLIEGY